MDTYTSKNAGNDNQLMAYAELVQLSPDNKSHLRHYAALLIEHGQSAKATEQLHRLHHLLTKEGQLAQAEALCRQYPQLNSTRKELRRHITSLETLLPGGMQNRLWQRLHQKRLQEGQYLIHPGERSDALFLVREGELAEFTNGDNDTPILLNLLAAGEIIGGHILFQQSQQKTYVIANKQSTIIRLPHSKMISAIESHPTLKIALQQRQHDRNLAIWISTCPLLQHIPLKMRREMAGESHLQTYEANTLIHKAGDNLSHVELIIQGSASYLLRSGEITKHLKSLTPGSLVGAMANIQDNRCPADLVSSQEVEILHIPQAVFNKVADAYPPLKKQLFTYAEKQQLHLMQSLDELQTQQWNKEQEKRKPYEL
ncbi:cyclic nucleotide-binding domain-containing protein [Mariprofundus erugo]|uniref:Cyclic nucleotide-binding domain-containing protein n=1 Tax=Mariprofundus erugo TaxID=2528639 RepID=A0A5R9GVH4_9PROT|nr:cyclic nucleotide-binding domain-containing protein [Mariprofundus erugo]TLS67982.1 cyclic nucleotide-binding domain-containing protein [Mariprofundus erugo]